ncbi:hypothetical protein A6A04_01740 [Paramagnetospirillum marisnigri]|uniref:DUF3828 domain-containing protein n=1 Tax=Paramagnetospirillum marisnigri TaxID=1285242 RepID=A0A178MPX5_9PROT|nr:hypothetical protein A6A04_01740 [Paramagnetospirillum marisnigri]
MGTVRTSQPIKSIVVLLSLLVAPFASSPSLGEDATSVTSTFHRPHSSPERAVNALLKVEATPPLGDSRLHQFLIDYKGGRRLHHKLFGRHFTSAYLDAVAAFERELVVQNCGGEYVEGDMCGLESSPINCAQDVAPHGYWYRTEHSTGDTAIILAAWKRSGPWTARYRMKKESRGWVVDGVECPLGDRYNWPDGTAAPNR